MPQRSDQDKLLHALHVDVQKDILSTFVVPFLCYDSSDYETDADDDCHTALVAKLAAYAAMEDTRYFFRAPVYHLDRRGAGMSDAIPRWKQILSGTIYNDEEFLKFFHVPRDMFLNFAWLFKHHPGFSSNIKQRHHYSHKLHLLVALKYFGSQGNAASYIHVKDGLGIGKGTALNYIDRAVVFPKHKDQQGRQSQ
jgi:hypothetical protein